LGEFAELNALRRTDDIARLKQFITCTVDHYRPPYGQEPRDYKRRVVLCGTTNDEAWAHDPTGNRRFIPITVGKIDLDWLRQNRDQLFAEAVTLYKTGRKWWKYPREATLEIQDARRPEDPWTEPVRAYLQGRNEIGDAGEVLLFACSVDVERQTPAQLIRVGMLLKKFGCIRQNQRRVKGARHRPWSVPADLAAGRVISGFAPVSTTSNDDLI
jgi:predicted P-loop ATPase